MVNVEIIIGLIAVAVLGAIFLPLAFDTTGFGGTDFINCEQNEIIKYVFVNGTLKWTCADDETGSTEIVEGTFANENTEFRPHLVQGTNVQDPIKDFGEYSIRVLEFLSDEFGEVSWDYLVPQDYELGEDLEFIVYWFKEDGLPDQTIFSHYNEESTACLNTVTTATPLIITDSVEYDFEEGEDYLIIVNTAWGNDEAHKGVSELNVKHGSTIFEGSKMLNVIHKKTDLPCNLDDDFYKYFWWTIWQPNATEATQNISFNVDNTDNDGVGAIVYDDTTITILKLSDHFIEDTHWFYDSNSTLTDIENSWATDSSASVTFTPYLDNGDWLVFGSNLNNQTSKDYALETRLLSSGSVSSGLPHVIRTGEAQGSSPTTLLDNFENDLMSFARVFTLSNSTSQTFTIQTQIEDGEINPDIDQPTPDQRLHNQILVLDLNTFSDHAFVWTPTILDVTANNFNQFVNGIVVNATTDDKNLFILADIGISDPQVNLRTQLNDVDVLPDETLQSYDWEDDINNNDVGRWALTTVSSPLLNGTYTVDVDAGNSGGMGSREVQQRSLVAFILEATPLTPEFETVCMEVRLMSVDVGEDLSSNIVPTHTPYKEACSTTSGGADILRTFTFNFNNTENPFEAEEVGIIQLKRHGDNSTNDDYSGKVFALFGELQWIVESP